MAKKAKRWNLKQQVAFFETLADMLNSGFSIKQSMQNLSILYPHLSEDLKDVYVNLTAGKSFSESTRQYLTFNISNQLVIAEKHGQLILCVKQLGKYLHKKQAQKEKLIGVLIYPLILLGLLIIMISIFAIWLKPTLSSLDMNNSMDHFQKIYGQVIKVILMISLLALSGYFLKILIWWKHQGSLKRHDWYSHLPILGKVYRLFAYYYLSFNLALLLKSGLNLQEICLFLRSFESKSLISELGNSLEKHLVSGKRIDHFIDKYAFIPAELKIFFNKGYTNQELSKDLMIYSKTQYQKMMRAIDNLINVVQPLLFLIIALVIIAVYLSILLPMYSSLGGINQ